MSEEKFEQVFLVTQPARLVVSNIRGSIRLQNGEAAQMRVESVKHTSSGDAARTEIELKQEEDGTVNVKTRYPDISLGWLSGSQPCKVDYIITAPRQTHLNVNGVSCDVSAKGFEGEASFKLVSGNLNLSDLNGELTVNIVSGDLELEQVTGRMKLHTVSGDIKGRKATGNAHVDTVSGNVHLGESSLPSVEAESVSGNLELQTGLGDGPYRFHSVSGDVRLTVQPETHCSAELHSMSGRISTNLPQSASTRDHGKHTVEIGGGGVKVTLNSVSGNLSLSS
jgi:DUF4097 and DUF4098 domain-containing protein YvlB